MNASASGAERPDIRVGDLVKATHKKRPESTLTGRVTGTTENWVDAIDWSAKIPDHDFEVLDRALPPIPKELLFGAIDAYRKADGMKAPTADHHLQPECYGDSITAVINYLREHDTYNKENSK